MVSRQKGGPTVTYARAFLSSGFRDVLFPIDVALLLRVLPEAGFVLAGGMPRTIPVGARLGIRADNVASKGDFQLALNSERGFIGLDGPAPELVTKEFIQLKGFFHERLGLAVDAKATFHEFLSSGSISGNRNPLETFTSLSQPLETLRRLKDSLGEDLALFGVRLSPSGQDPNRPDWTEIVIEPMVEQATQFYHFEVVYRRRNAKPVIEFAEGFGRTIEKLIGSLEEG